MIKYSNNKIMIILFAIKRIDINYILMILLSFEKGFLKQRRSSFHKKIRKALKQVLKLSNRGSSTLKMSKNKQNQKSKFIKYGTVRQSLTVPQCFINLYDLIRNSYFKNSSRFFCSFPTPVLPYFLLLLLHSISLWLQSKCSERCYSTHCTVASQKCYRLVKHS